MPVPNADVLARLRALPGAAAVLAVLGAEPGVYVVGGAVRDALLDRRPGELDFVVEGDAEAVARRAARALGGEALVHDRFGTATVRTAQATFDLAASRREAYAAPGALPDVELGVPLREDLARRDFTVNALAVHLADGALTTWPGAPADLEAGILRVLHPASFRDDPTRLVRLARYAARLGFEPDPETDRLAREAIAGGALATVSGARVGGEVRLLAREPQPAGVAWLERAGLGSAAVHPAFAAAPDVVARALAAAPPDARTDLVALAACLVDAPAGELAARLDLLAFPRGDRDTVLAAAARARPLARALNDPELRRPSQLWRLLRREPDEAVVLAAALAGEAGAAAAARWLDELRHVRLAITGHDLLAAGLAGPAVGAGLEAALAAALDGEAPDAQAQLAAAMAATRG